MSELIGFESAIQNLMSIIAGDDFEDALPPEPRQSRKRKAAPNALTPPSISGTQPNLDSDPLSALLLQSGFPPQSANSFYQAVPKSQSMPSPQTVFGSEYPHNSQAVPLSQQMANSQVVPTSPKGTETQPSNEATHTTSQVQPENASAPGSDITQAKESQSTSCSKSRRRQAKEENKMPDLPIAEHVVPEDPEFDLGQVFDSADMAIAAMNCYERRNNLKYCTAKTSHLRKQYEYRCVYGKALGEGKKVKGMGCPSKIRIYFRSRDGGYTVKELGRVHSHPLVTPPPEKPKTPIPEEIIPLVRELNKCGTPPDIIMEYCRKLYFRQTGKKLPIKLDKLIKYIETNFKGEEGPLGIEEPVFTF